MNVDPLECNIVKNCAATLAGLGTAGIFNADCPDPLCLEKRLRELNLRLSPKGVKAEVLFFRKNTGVFFARVRKCTEIYRKALENGMSIDRLTVSVRTS